ncbi:hypothetical protein LTR36_010346 [Oleoguttula mirabilis]|uniref:Secreted protein n=1 Tax=Oleoguttula mirabilis TaxID=1507867 RepID=A0AAV9J4Q1_9PEZI|nr:hypothetical protein LTR36_010346 [Oleoguttula mirabilis]
MFASKMLGAATLAIAAIITTCAAHPTFEGGSVTTHHRTAAIPHVFPTNHAYTPSIPHVFPTPVPMVTANVDKRIIPTPVQDDSVATAVAEANAAGAVPKRQDVSALVGAIESIADGSRLHDSFTDYVRPRDATTFVTKTMSEAKRDGCYVETVRGPQDMITRTLRSLRGLFGDSSPQWVAPAKDESAISKEFSGVEECIASEQRAQMANRTLLSGGEHSVA